MQIREHGFTLIELLIVLALLAIMAQIALPAWQAFVYKHRSQALRNNVERAVHQARATAITRRMSIELCGSKDGKECTDDWSEGWLMRALPRNKQPEEPSYINKLDDSQQIKLQWAGFRPRIIFHANGYSTASNGRFFVCRDHEIDWQLILNRQGRLRHSSNKENSEQGQRCTR